MGNMFVRRPDLFGAVCCAVPLLDMKAYHQLLAGASWMAEYGNPDVPEVSASCSVSLFLVGKHWAVCCDDHQGVQGFPFSLISGVII